MLGFPARSLVTVTAMVFRLPTMLNSCQLHNILGFDGSLGLLNVLSSCLRSFFFGHGECIFSQQVGKFLPRHTIYCVSQNLCHKLFLVIPHPQLREKVPINMGLKVNRFRDIHCCV